MPYIQLDDKQFPLRSGEARIGGGAAEIPLPGLGASSAVLAVLTSGAGGEAVIRRAPDGAAEGEVRVNGVRLGAEPIPLLHGDRIEAAGAELLFGDERGASSTQSLSASAVRSRLADGGAAGNGARKEGRRTAATGGRLVSLVDGREYAVPPGGITIGRDAGCDVVVPTGDVSRRHAVIAPGAHGYELRDTSTNGVFVNDERVPVVRVLGRGDVLQVGDAQFRFYADTAPVTDAPPITPPAGAPRAESAPRPVLAPASPSPEPQAAAPVATSAVRAPVAAPSAAERAADARPVLATLEIINQGMLRGRKFAVRTPLAHIGRGAHNDVVIPDESVSDTHAKLQKREAGWYVVDMDSTNGTYVAGTRIAGEQRLVGTPDVRFGGVKMIFQSAAPADGDAVGTRAIARRGAVAEPVVPAATPAPARVADAAASEVSSSGGAAGRWGLVALIAAVVGFVVVYLLRQGR